MAVNHTSLREGWQREQRGDVSGAEAQYRAVLAQDSGCAEAWFRLGVVCLRQQKLLEAVFGFQKARAGDFKPAEASNLEGVAFAWMNRPTEAEQAFRRAVAISPAFVDAYVNHARSLRELGKYDEALASLRTALTLAPRCVAAWENLAGIHETRGDLAVAAGCLANLLELQPANVSAHLSRGRLLARMGQSLDAERSYRTAIQLGPDRADAYLGLGVLLAEHRYFAEAKDLFHRAVELDSGSIDAYSNLGNAQRELGMTAESRVNLERALALDPDHESALINLGKWFADEGDFERAAACYRRILNRDGAEAAAHVGLGSVLAQQGNREGAVDQLTCALRKNPEHAQAHFNLALIHLQQGDWDRGWQEYEWRWQTKAFVAREFSQPAWTGERCAKATVLLYCEQGLGDTLLFCRYAPWVRERVGRVVLECPRAMVPILGSCSGVDELVATGDPLPAFDRHAALMSVPRIFGTTPTAVPARVPYLVPEADRVARWCRHFSKGRDFRVGIVWRGSPDYRGDRNRSVSPACFEPLARVERVRLVSLQKGDMAREIANLADRFEILDLGAELDRDGAFLDTAAVMQHLDLVVSVDSAPAHLAGALGVPVWVALGSVADWRWLLDREDTPWYPTMRLFRQSTPHVWEPVFSRMAAELRTLVQQTQASHAPGAG